MTETVRNTKLVQYLSEAYAKEKELETALEAHIGVTTRRPYKKRLQGHLKETKRHARELERRIKKVGGGDPQLAKLAGQVSGQVKSLAKAPLHIVRGTGEAEKMLKNAKAQYWNEHEEIATYTAIEALAESLNDRETAQLARSIRRDEERMAKFLAGQIKTLTKAVVTEEIPAKERSVNGPARKRASSTRKRTTAARKRATSSRKRATSTRKRSTSTSSRTRSRSSSSRSRARSGSGSSRRRS